MVPSASHLVTQRRDNAKGFLNSAILCSQNKLAIWNHFFDWIDPFTNKYRLTTHDAGVLAFPQVLIPVALHLEEEPERVDPLVGEIELGDEAEFVLGERVAEDGR